MYLTHLWGEKWLQDALWEEGTAVEAVRYTRQIATKQINPFMATVHPYRSGLIQQEHAPCYIIKICLGMV